MNARIELLPNPATTGAAAWHLPHGYCAPYPPRLDQPPPLLMSVGHFAMFCGRALRTIGRHVVRAVMTTPPPRY